MIKLEECLIEVLKEFGHFLYYDTIDKDKPFEKKNIEKILDKWLSLSYIRDWVKIKELIE